MTVEKPTPVTHTNHFHINICYSSAVPREHPRDSHRALSACHFCCHLEAAAQWKEIPGNRPSFPSLSGKVFPQNVQVEQVEQRQRVNVDVKVVERKVVVAAETKNSRRKVVKIKEKCELKRGLAVEVVGNEMTEVEI